MEEFDKKIWEICKEDSEGVHGISHEGRDTGIP